MRSLLSVATAVAAGLVVSPSPAPPAAQAPAAVAEDASTYTPLTPVRVLDTNAGSRFTPTDYNRRFSLELGARQTAEYDFSTAVPESATALTLNVTT